MAISVSEYTWRYKCKCIYMAMSVSVQYDDGFLPDFIMLMAGANPAVNTPRPSRGVCVCFLPIHSGRQVHWTYQPGSHRRKVTQGFSSTFFLRCVP